MEIYILISLYNYFIMHDIKYFFSIKLIKQSRGQKKISGGKLPKSLPKNIIFFKIQVAAIVDPP
jgi:hypothetical protein